MGRKNETAISNEEIISALISNNTISGAAAAAGISSRAIYDRMGDKDFIAEYQAAKAAIVRQSVINLNNHIAGAINTIAEVMQNKETNAAVRLQAAQTILNSAAKFAERLEAAENIAADARRSPFDFF